MFSSTLKSLWNPFNTLREIQTDPRKNKLISRIFLWKKQIDSTAPHLKFQKGVSPFRCLGKKRLSKRKEKPFLTARAWFPFKYPLLDSTHYAIVPPLICHSNRSVCQILIPLSVAGWLNGFLPMGLMSSLPFRNRTKLPKHSWNREHHKPWVLLTYPRLAEAYHLSSFHHRFLCIGFCKAFDLNTGYPAHIHTVTLPQYNHYTQHCPSFC